MDRYDRSDLACESFSSREGLPMGASHSRERIGGFGILRLRVSSAEASEILQKPCGSYVTVETGRLGALSDDGADRLAHLLAGELRGISARLTGRIPDSEFGVFVAGLGNAELTADAIGPKTVGMLTATRHLREHEGGLYRRLGCSSLSAMAPGVLGQTGIETLEILRGAVRFVRPDVVILVDALAARSCDRLAATVQISDVGISPGSGVGNHRTAITRESLGVPVISVGVPTVVNSATLVYDALTEAGIEEIGDSLHKVLENGRSFFVSPKESDVITHEVAKLLSRSIALAFTGGY